MDVMSVKTIIRENYLPAIRSYVEGKVKAEIQELVEKYTMEALAKTQVEASEVMRDITRIGYTLDIVVHFAWPKNVLDKPDDKS